MSRYQKVRLTLLGLLLTGHDVAALVERLDAAEARGEPLPVALEEFA